MHIRMRSLAHQLQVCCSGSGSGSILAISGSYVDDCGPQEGQAGVLFQGVPVHFSCWSCGLCDSERQDAPPIGQQA